MGLPANLTNQSITHYPKASLDSYGRETFAAPVTYYARVERVSKARHSATGQTVLVEAIAYIPDDAGIGVNDKVAYGGVNYKVFSVKGATDGQGNTHHTKYELIKWV